MPEKIQLNLGVPRCHFPPPTLEQVIEAINKKIYPEKKKKELIEKAKKTPSSGLRHFLKRLK